MRDVLVEQQMYPDAVDAHCPSCGEPPHLASDVVSSVEAVSAVGHYLVTCKRCTHVYRLDLRDIVWPLGTVLVEALS